MANEEKNEEKPIEEAQVKPIEYNLKPEVIQKNKKLERLNASLGNNQPTKAKLTNLTFTSFRDNLEGDGIVKIMDSLNSNIGALRDKITEEATKKAEEEARKEVNAEQAMDEMANLVQDGTNRQVDRKKIENILALKLEAALTRASNPENVNPILKSCTMALKKPSGHSFEMMEGQVPKAIMIPAMLKKYISKVGNNIQKYEGTDLTTEENKTDKVALSAKKAEKKAPEVKKEPKWKKAFGNVKAPEEVKPVIDDTKIEIISIDSKVTSDELRERRTLAEAGESLSEIKRLEQGIGLGEPFNNGLQTRKRDLRKIIGDITGVQLPEETNRVVKQEKTEFQNRLEEVLGIKEAPTKQEHEAIQEKYDEYFNDPDFVKHLERQKLEGILYDINTPEFAKSIDEAERIDNERKAVHNQQTNMEIIGEEKEETKEEIKEEPKIEEVKVEEKPVAKKDDKLRFGLRAKKAFQKIINLRTEGKEQGKILFEEEQKAEIKDSASIEANRLYTLNKIALGAELQAKDLFKNNERADLLIGAEEQAKILKSISDRANNEQKEIELAALETAKDLKNKNDRVDLVNAAEEQAKALEEENEKIEILAFAEEQAMALRASNEKIEVLDLAKKQAKNLKASNEKIEVLNLAEEQAKVLKNSNDKVELANAAEEQAKMLKNSNEVADLLNGAEEQAKMLKNSNEVADLLNGAEEQAKMLKNSNEVADLLNGAEEQARMLNTSNAQNELLNAAEQQAKALKRNNDRVEILNGAEEQAKILKSNNERVDLLNGAEEQAKKIQEMNLILAAAELQARAIFNSETQTILGEEAKTQAQQLFERDQMMEAKVKAMEEKKQKELEKPSFEFTDSRSKYAEIIDYSKPIKLVKDRFDNLYKYSQNKYKEELSSDDTVVSLNEVFNDWEATPETV